MDIDALSKKITDLEKRVEALEAPTRASENEEPLASVQPVVKQMSAKEFLLSKKISSALERTLALAYYLEHIGGMSAFNVNDIENVFQSAREKPPVNPNDMINKNIAKGYLMESREQKDGKKSWILTATGEKVVENELSNLQI